MIEFFIRKCMGKQETSGGVKWRYYHGHNTMEKVEMYKFAVTFAFQTGTLFMHVNVFLMVKHNKAAFKNVTSVF